jgi:hypothetical protein
MAFVICFFSLSLFGPPISLPPESLKFFLQVDNNKEVKNKKEIKKPDKKIIMTPIF